MPPKVIYERFWWFHKQVKAGKYPNARKLAQRFELSVKTARRDIEFIRDRLNAPLVYLPEKRGYEYEHRSYELPGIWIKEDELVGLLVLSRLASGIPNKNLKTSLASFLQQFFTFHSLNLPVSFEELIQKVSVKKIRYSQVRDTIFQKVIDPLFYTKPLKIIYYSPHKDEISQRDILPLHLLQYMGNWHTIAYCSLRDELRDFALSRIQTAIPATKNINPDISSGFV